MKHVCRLWTPRKYWMWKYAEGVGRWECSLFSCLGLCLSCLTLCALIMAFGCVSDCEWNAVVVDLLWEQNFDMERVRILIKNVTGFFYVFFFISRTELIRKIKADLIFFRGNSFELFGKEQNMRKKLPPNWYWNRCITPIIGVLHRY
jgi:hypothetical protein